VGGCGVRDVGFGYELMQWFMFDVVGVGVGVWCWLRSLRFTLPAIRRPLLCHTTES
jgi:hypothetical protein